MKNTNQSRLVLASSSPWRRELLGRISADFDWVAPPDDEVALEGEDPAATALRLARLKASRIATLRPGTTVIGSDQVAVFEGRLRGKPGNREAAVRQLLEYRGRTLRFLTSVCIIHGPSGEERVHTDVTEVRFRHFEPRLAERYVDHDRPWHCAGGFKAEGAGVVLFERIDSRDPTGLIGLPLIWVAQTLEALGLPLL